MLAEWLFLIIGLNHKTAPIELREKLSFNPTSSFLKILKKEITSFKEAFSISTCNRVEFGFVLEREKRILLLEEFAKFLENTFFFSWGKFKNHFYLLENEEAVRHLFEVSCGLDSMVLGEPQILGQVKSCYQQALEARTCGLILNKLFHRAFFVAKKVRTETGIGGGAVSVSYAAYKLAKKILGSLKDKVLLLIGAGEMAELACLHFLSAGIQKIIIANRTFSKAVELAEKFKGEAFPLENLSLALTSADIVISSTSATHFIITQDMIAPLLRIRKYKPLFIIDIAVPRNVDPKVNNLENVYLYNIDDLKLVVEENLKEREKASIRAKAIIEEEVLKFKKWAEELEIHPTIKALVQKAESLRQKELSKTLKKLKNLSQEDKEALEILTYSLVQKLLYYPINYLKKGYHENGKYAINIIRQIFELDEPSFSLLELKEDEIFEESSSEKTKSVNNLIHKKFLLQ